MTFIKEVSSSSFRFHFSGEAKSARSNNKTTLAAAAAGNFYFKDSISAQLLLIVADFQKSHFEEELRFLSPLVVHFGSFDAKTASFGSSISATKVLLAPCLDAQEHLLKESFSNNQPRV